MPLQIGQALGHYRILRQLGAGGMGEVYEAEDTKLGRKVALKILPEETARDPQRRERFEREAKAVAALNHPGIVTIHSVEEAGGVDFITMELVEGQSLRRLLPREGLPLGRLLDLAIPMADAVAAAHQRGITHRDLKPENVLVGRDGKVKVLDFGLAKVGPTLGDAGSASHLPTRALTAEGHIVGTVAYMSPEQAEGKPVDPRSDVFSLGIILYEMSTGERPFKGETSMSILSSILKDTPPPVTQVNATLPRDVAHIVNRCLSKDPVLRFQTAQGLATELVVLKQESDSGELDALPAGGARPASVTAPAASPAASPAAPRTRTLWYAGIAAAVAAFTAAGYLGLRGWRGAPAGGGPSGATGRTAIPAPPAGGGVPGAAPTDSRQKIVVLPFENLGAADDAYFGAGVTEEISSRLAAVSGLGVISRTSAAQYVGTGKTTRQIGQELGVDYVLEGTVRWQRGAGKSSRVRVTPQLVRVADDMQLWSDHYDREMKDIFAVQSEIAEQVVGKLGLAVGQAARAAGGQPTQNLDAYQLFLRGKEKSHSTSLAPELPQQAVELLEQAVRIDPRFAQAWAELSYAHSLIYHSGIDLTEERLAKSRECADKALSLQPDLREGHLALGYYYYWGRRDYGQADEEFRKAAGGREDDPEALQAMSYVKRRQGRFDEALAEQERAFALNPKDVNLLINMSGTYQAVRRYPEAMRSMDLAVSLAPGVRMLKVFLQIEMEGDTRAARETLRGISRSDVPELPGFEAYVDTLEGRYKEALEHLAEYPHDVIETETFYRPRALLQGLTYLFMNDQARARAACESARQTLDKAIARTPRDPRIRSALGLALACLGRKEEAIREARLACDITPVSSDALDGPAYLEVLASVYGMVGEPDAALDILEKLIAGPYGLSANLLRIDPTWKPLRTHPRFKKLVGA